MCLFVCCICEFYSETRVINIWFVFKIVILLAFLGFAQNIVVNLLESQIVTVPLWLMSISSFIFGAFGGAGLYNNGLTVYLAQICPRKQQLMSRYLYYVSIRMFRTFLVPKNCQENQRFIRKPLWTHQKSFVDVLFVSWTEYKFMGNKFHYFNTVIKNFKLSFGIIYYFWKWTDSQLYRSINTWKSTKISLKSLTNSVYFSKYWTKL